MQFLLPIALRGALRASNLIPRRIASSGWFIYRSRICPRAQWRSWLGACLTSAQRATRSNHSFGVTSNQLEGSTGYAQPVCTVGEACTCHSDRHRHLSRKLARTAHCGRSHPTLRRCLESRSPTSLTSALSGCLGRGRWRRLFVWRTASGVQLRPQFAVRQQPVITTSLRSRFRRRSIRLTSI